MGDGRGWPSATATRLGGRQLEPVRLWPTIRTASSRWVVDGSGREGASANGGAERGGHERLAIPVPPTVAVDDPATSRACLARIRTQHVHFVRVGPIRSLVRQPTAAERSPPRSSPSAIDFQSSTRADDARGRPLHLPRPLRAQRPSRSIRQRRPTDAQQLAVDGSSTRSFLRRSVPISLRL